MRLIKKAITTTLARCGYGIARIKQQSAIKDERVVYHGHYLGHEFQCFKDGIISDAILTGRGWDVPLKEALRDCFARKASRIVVEVGANIGASFVPIANNFQDASFYLFEPVHEFFTLLQNNVKNYGLKHAQLMNLALSDEHGRSITLRVDMQNAGTGNPLPDTYPLSVDTTTLDRYFGGRDIAFLKVDTDGSELAVLRGGARLIRRCQPDIFVEFHPILMRTLSVSPASLLDTLFDLGMELFTVYDSSGTLLETTSSRGRILEIADGAEFYVDLLARSGDRAK